jgi:rubrerythrin
MTDKLKLPESNQPWQCETCGSGFAEYINGCPHCYEAGIMSSVRRVAGERG